MSIPKEKYSFTEKQGQYLAFIYNYSKINGQAPAQRDIQQFFNVTPPTIHQMILHLEKKNFIRRVPNTPRSLSINIPINLIPKLK